MRTPLCVKLRTQHGEGKLGVALESLQGLRDLTYPQSLPGSEGTRGGMESIQENPTSAPFSFALLVCGIGLSSLALGWSSAKAAGPPFP